MSNLDRQPLWTLWTRLNILDIETAGWMNSYVHIHQEIYTLHITIYYLPKWEQETIGSTKYWGEGKNTASKETEITIC